MTSASQLLLAPTADAPAHGEALEAFLSTILVDAGLWRARESDGVRFFRVVDDGPERARICGELWTVDQVRHVFWLDVVPATDGFAWELRYDLLPGRARHAVHRLDAPDAEAWSATLSGRA